MRWAFVLYLVSIGFHLTIIPLCHVSFFLLNHKCSHNRNWSKSSLQFFRCCFGSFCDLLDKSFMLSWSNFCRLATPGYVHHCFFHLWIMASSMVHQSLGLGLANKSELSFQKMWLLTVNSWLNKGGNNFFSPHIRSGRFG